jgi:hypothetical protein
MNELPELIKAFGLIDCPVDSPVEYRLYYSETGVATFMSGSDGPSGNYINITQEIYNRAIVHNLRVVRGALVVVDAAHLWLQLHKSDVGHPVVKSHPALIIEPNETYTDIEFYGRIN